MLDLELKVLLDRVEVAIDLRDSEIFRIEVELEPAVRLEPGLLLEGKDTKVRFSNFQGTLKPPRKCL